MSAGGGGPITSATDVDGADEAPAAVDVDGADDEVLGVVADGAVEAPDESDESLVDGAGGHESVNLESGNTVSRR